MGNLRRWSSTATGNATVAGGVNTINFAEGQTPGSVNNSARELMAQVRGIYTPSDWGWVENSATASVASQTTFKLAGNQTTDWVAPRRWRLKSGSTTRYGSVVSSSFTTETTITVTVDSGSLSASHSLAALSVIDANHVPTTYLTSASVATSLSSFITSASVASSYAPLASPTFTGTPTAPTAAGGTNTTQIATTAFVQNAVGSMTLLGTLTTTSGATQTLSGLSLGSYTIVRLMFNGVSFAAATAVTLGTATIMPSVASSSTYLFYGFCDVILSTGNAVAVINTPTSVTTATGGGGATGYSTATTSISVTASGSTFDAGSITVWGIK